MILECLGKNAFLYLFQLLLSNQCPALFFCYRFHGRKLAEMPFAGTLPAYQKQGMMRRLVKAVEKVHNLLNHESSIHLSFIQLIFTAKRFSNCWCRLSDSYCTLKLIGVGVVASGKSSDPGRR